MCDDDKGNDGNSKFIVHADLRVFIWDAFFSNNKELSLIIFNEDGLFCFFNWGQKIYGSLFVVDDEAVAVSSGTDFTWDFMSCDEIDDDGIRLSLLGDRNVYLFSGYRSLPSQGRSRGRFDYLFIELFGTFTSFDLAVNPPTCFLMGQWWRNETCS